MKYAMLLLIFLIHQASIKFLISQLLFMYMQENCLQCLVLIAHCTSHPIDTCFNGLVLILIYLV